MSFKILNLSRPYEPYDLRVLRNMSIVSQENWDKALEPFAVKARHHAANLAAHNWDVFIFEGDLIMSSAQGGSVASPGEEMVRLEYDLIDEFYPIVPEYGVDTTVCWDEMKMKGTKVEIRRQMFLNIPSLGGHEAHTFNIANRALIDYARLLIRLPKTQREKDAEAENVREATKKLWTKRGNLLQDFWNTITEGTEIAP